MPRSEKPEPHFPVRLTQAQRKIVAEVAPEMAKRLKLDEANQRTITFTLAELKSLKAKADTAVHKVTTGTVRNSFRHILDAVSQVLERTQGLGAIPARERVFQFKITLLDTSPPIWRRIQVKDDTLDKLHEDIQTAMGWTNSHLHDFKIEGKDYGDPLLMEENFEEFDYGDSTTTKLSEILPKTGKGFRFEYKYDFGDSWKHEVLFEGMVQAEPGGRYPVCLEGARACPPEDVGGTWGYEDFLAALADPSHERHEQYQEWIGREFDAEHFDAATATKRMRRGVAGLAADALTQAGVAQAGATKRVEEPL
jgi:hypothetical protein